MQGRKTRGSKVDGGDAAGLGRVWGFYCLRPSLAHHPGPRCSATPTAGPAVQGDLDLGGWASSFLRGPRFPATTLDPRGGRRDRRSPCPAPTPGRGSLFSPRDEHRGPATQMTRRLGNAGATKCGTRPSWPGRERGPRPRRALAVRWGGGVPGRPCGKPRSQGCVPGSAPQLPPSCPPRDGRGEVTCVTGGVSLGRRERPGSGMRGWRRAARGTAPSRWGGGGGARASAARAPSLARPFAASPRVCSMFRSHPVLTAGRRA